MTQTLSLATQRQSIQACTHLPRGQTANSPGNALSAGAALTALGMGANIIGKPLPWQRAVASLAGSPKIPSGRKERQHISKYNKTVWEAV